jgi:hypothetical protein
MYLDVIDFGDGGVWATAADAGYWPLLPKTVSIATD